MNWTDGTLNLRSLFGKRRRTLPIFIALENSVVLGTLESNNRRHISSASHGDATNNRQRAQPKKPRIIRAKGEYSPLHVLR